MSDAPDGGRGRALATAALAWAFPGLGHYYLGAAGPPSLFALIVAARFRARPLVRGHGSTRSSRDSRSRSSRPSPSPARGSWNVAARLFSDNPGGTVLAPTYEYGCAFLLTAGLMNLLLMLDAWDIATGRKK